MSAHPKTPFHDLDHFVAVPRVGGLALSPHGKRLATIVTTLDAKKTRYTNAVWLIDPDGAQVAHRVTRSSRGESGAAFDAQGNLYFISARPDPDADGDDPVPALWMVPASGGEARLVVSRPGGIASVHTGRDGGVFVTADLMPGAEQSDDVEKADAEIREVRSKNKVSAILHSASMVRYWDHDLGPGTTQVFAVEDAPAEPSSPSDDESTTGDAHEPDASADAPSDDPSLPGTVDAVARKRLRLLTRGIGAGLQRGDVHVSPAGDVLLATRMVPAARGDVREAIVRIDVASGTWRDAFVPEAGRTAEAGPISPDGASALVVTGRDSTPEQAPTAELGVLELASGALTPLAQAWDRWATPLDWFPDGASVLVQADQDGRGPLFRIVVATGEVRQVTDDESAYSTGIVSPDGQTVFGVRSSYAFPPEVVRVNVATGVVIRLPNPVERPALPGRLTEVEAQAPDGARVRGWLCLPDGADAAHPAPLALWIHGGPLSSWNAWSWRWNPWAMVARGYAVLLPDPALSTGYGQDFVQRGWGAWGAAPYTDLMAITDAVEVRDDIDARRTVAMGGSFGGYMANWVAGHTDRFAGIVTHASLWALDQFGPTTDASHYWSREMSPQMQQENSPHAHVAAITTPMLVVHGDKDYRVPIGEGLRLWWDLLSASGLPADDEGRSPHRFLYFPDENHWILTPQHAKVWYDVVLGFVDEQVHGRTPSLPKALGLAT